MSRSKIYSELRSMTVQLYKATAKKCPDNLILHIETNNTINKPSKEVLVELLVRKKFIEKALPESNVPILNLITQTDNGKNTLTAIKKMSIYMVYKWISSTMDI